MTAGTRLKHAGQADVLAADHAVHRDTAGTIRAALDVLAASGTEFTAEDLRAMLPDDLAPHSQNLLPAVMGAEARAGRIVGVGFTKSTRSSRRDGWLRLWRGTTTEVAP